MHNALSSKSAISLEEKSKHEQYLQEFNAHLKLASLKYQVFHPHISSATSRLHLGTLITPS